MIHIDQHIEKFAPLDLHGVKFERFCGIFDPILCIFAKMKMQVVSSMY